MRYSVSEILKTIYKIFSSTTLTIVLLLFSCLIYLIGTVFPQGVSLDDYAKAGGKFLFFAKYFFVLNVFHSWYLGLIISILLLNLLLCTIKRIKDSKGLIKIFSIIYHLIFLSIILMLFISNRVSMEDEIQVEEGNTKYIELQKGEKIELHLNRFSISYTEVPDYMKQKGLWSRLKVIFLDEGARKIINQGEFHKSYRQFTADIEVNYKDREYKHLLRVNNSLVFSSYSLNLYSFEHLIEVKINDKTYNVKSGDEFVDDNSEKYKLSEVFSGNILHLDGSESFLEPEVSVYKKIGQNLWEQTGKLKKGFPIKINKVNFEFVDYNQSVVFGIKYDSTVKYFKVLSFLSIFFMLSVTMNKMRGKN